MSAVAKNHIRRVPDQSDQRDDRKATARLNLIYPAETRRRLEELQKATGAATLTDTIANAIRVYEWFTAQRAARREILVREPSGDARLVEFLL